MTKPAILELLKDHIEKCDICIITSGNDAAVCPEAVQMVIDAGLFTPDITHTYVLEAPKVDFKMDIPSRQRKPWSKRYKGQGRIGR